MYGDIGHGFLMTLFSLFLIYKEKDLEKQVKAKTLNEILSMAFGGRYLLLLMGLFAVYCGSIYNDCVSIPLALYRSGWYFPNGQLTANNTGSVYPYGVDYSWYQTQNELLFFNSLKMKLSVTLGVIQMTFGVLLSLSNHLYFKDYLGMIFEFIPQLTFLLCTFGYMIFLIIYKLCLDWTTIAISPPNLIQTMIAMFLSPGTVSSSNQLYPYQGLVQGILVLFAVGSVPVMLFVKPCIMNCRHKAAQARSPQQIVDLPSPQELKEEDEHGVDVKMEIDPRVKKTAVHSGGQGGHDDHGGSGEYSFSDHLISQSIHTIEYVLGTVSNTASYLRLWALSLAHAKLAEVFWDKLMMQYGVDIGVGVFVGFTVWAFATFAVLLCMDVLECFLHALRLHWVEFQNKFFHADGYAFEPFNFVFKENDS